MLNLCTLHFPFSLSYFIVLCLSRVLCSPNPILILVFWVGSCSHLTELRASSLLLVIFPKLFVFPLCFFPPLCFHVRQALLFVCIVALPHLLMISLLYLNTTLAPFSLVSLRSGTSFLLSSYTSFVKLRQSPDLYPSNCLLFSVCPFCFLP